MFSKKLLLSIASTLNVSLQSVQPALSNPVSLLTGQVKNSSEVDMADKINVRPKLIVLALHGMAMHGSTFDALKETLAVENILVVAPDLPGYGMQCLAKSAKCTFRSEASLELVEAQIKSIKDKLPDVPLILLGESLGGALAIDYASRNASEINGLILSAPALSFRALAGLKLAPKLLLSDNFADGQVVLQDKSSRKTTSLRELLRIRSFLSRAKSEVSNLSPDLPILVLHGSADKIISLRGSEFLVNHATSSNKKLEVFCGAGHLLLEVKHPRAEVLSAIDNWLADIKQDNSERPSFQTNADNLSNAIVLRK
jgi:acylglycerol lipase